MHINKRVPYGNTRYRAIQLYAALDRSIHVYTALYNPDGGTLYSAKRSTPKFPRNKSMSIDQASF